MDDATTHDPYGLHRHDEQGRCLEPCDSRECRALMEPETLDEYRVALEHCESHSYLAGCSHGN